MTTCLSSQVDKLTVSADNISRDDEEIEDMSDELEQTGDVYDDLYDQLYNSESDAEPSEKEPPTPGGVMKALKNDEMVLKQMQVDPPVEQELEPRYDDDEEEIPINLVMENNLLEPHVRKKFLKLLFDDPNDEIFSQLWPTTVTLSGILKNSDIKENTVDLYEPNDRVVVIISNYGKKTHESYVENVPTKKSTRGRKPKQKDNKKERKKQGNGNCFNSQITFIVRTDVEDGKKSGMCKEYKFKIFRNNKLQLPGAHPDFLDEIISANYEVVDVLNEVLHPDEPDPSKKAQLVCLAPQMKNYKFFLKMEYGQLINLELLHKLMNFEKIKEDLNVDKSPEEIEQLLPFCNCDERKCRKCDDLAIVRNEHLRAAIAEKVDYEIEAPKHPKVSDIKYTGEDTKLAVRFHTPIAGNPEKKTKVNIFPGKDIPVNYSDDIEPGTWGGKFNILGAFHEEDTSDIYLYLRYIFKKYYNRLVVTPGACDDSDEEYEIVIDESEELADNINIDDETIAEGRAREMERLFPPLPPIVLTEEESRQIGGLIKRWYGEYVDGLNILLSKLTISK